MAMTGYSALAAADPLIANESFPPAVEAPFEQVGEVIIEVVDPTDDTDPGGASAAALLLSRPVVAGIAQRIEGGDLVTNDKAMPPAPPHIGAGFMLKVLEEDSTPDPGQLPCRT